MSSILNNVAALGASRQMGLTGLGLQQTIQRLTTGLRINRASDDAAGLGISNKLRADIRIASQGKRNANDGTSYLQVADGVLDEVTNLLTRASELAQEAETGTLSDSNRANIDAEFQNILKTVIDIGQSTRFNGASVFSSSAVSVSVGGFSAIGITVGTISTATSALGLGTGTTTTSTVTVTGAGSNAYNTAVVFSSVPDGGAYYAADAMVSVVGAGNPLIIDAANQLSNAWGDWLLLGTSPTVHTQAAQADLVAYVAANPGDANGIASLAGINYLLSTPPPPKASGDQTSWTAEALAMAAAAAAGSNTYTSTTTSGGDSLATATDAASVATKLASALDSVSALRASLGASMQQLGAVSNSLGIQVENFTAAYSQITDANIADEVVNLTKFQILNQSGTSALGQANNAQQQILALLR